MQKQFGGIMSFGLLPETITNGQYEWAGILLRMGRENHVEVSNGSLSFPIGPGGPPDGKTVRVCHGRSAALSCQGLKLRRCLYWRFEQRKCLLERGQRGGLA